MVVGTLFATTSIQAANYYVSPSGNDSNSGTTETQPWRTIQQAGNRAAAGDTVYIAPGTYTGNGGPILQPARSGTATQPITFRSLNSTRPILSGPNTAPEVVDLSNRSYIVIDNLEIQDPCNDWCNWLTLSNSHHNVINNTRFTMTRSSQGVDWIGVDFDNSTYNRLTNCHVDGWGMHVDPYNNGGDAIQLHGASHHNVIEGCFIGAGGHAGLQLDGGDTYFNVIRNNTFQNPLEKAYETTQRRSGRFEYNLFEGNTCVQSGYNAEFHGGMCLHINANRNIIRRNILRGALGWGIDIQTWGPETITNVGNHFFQNTIVNNGLDQAGYNAYQAQWEGGPLAYTGMQVTDFGYTGAPHRDHRIKNNIFYDNKPQIGFNPTRKVQIQISFEPGKGPFSGTHIAGNLLYTTASGEQNMQVDGIGINTIDWFNQNHSNNFWGNISQAPIFEDYTQGTVNNPLDGSFNLRLRPNSPGVDQGVNLTQTTSAGSGTVITVQDAGYFHDGFDGIIAADQIVVGGTQVTIADIDYANNRITVDRSISWNANAGVNLPFNGNAPDMGAVESLPSGSPNPSPSASPSPSTAVSPTPSPSPSSNPSCQVADIDQNGSVGTSDRTLLLSSFFQTVGSNVRADINHNGFVDLSDYALLAKSFGQTCN